MQFVRDGKNGRYQPAFIDRESDFAAQRRFNGKRLDAVEKSS